jgi:hypothetical protein
LNQEIRAGKWSYGWFGGQIGGTAWMLGLALASPPLCSLVSVSGIVVFALINLIGLTMWRNQSRLDQHTCLQVLIAVTGLGSYCLLALMDASNCLQKWDPRIHNPKTAYLLLLIFPILSVWIWTANRRNSQQKQANQASHATSEPAPGAGSSAREG